MNILYNVYVSKVHSKMNEINEEVYENLQRAQLKQKQWYMYDKHTRMRTFNVGTSFVASPRQYVSGFEKSGHFALECICQYSLKLKN